jgi:molybdenum cofactor synthesis domain-containing protein
VITVSDKGAQGLREDMAGPAVRAELEGADFEVVYASVVPDERERIERELIACAERGIALVTTTGGTGFSPRDVTPEATIAVCERLTPGIPEAMRAESMKITNRAILARQQAGIRGETLIVNLPGSPKAAKENLAAVLPSLAHGLEMLRQPQRDHE